LCQTATSEELINNKDNQEQCKASRLGKKSNTRLSVQQEEHPCAALQKWHCQPFSFSNSSIPATIPTLLPQMGKQLLCWFARYDGT